MNHKKEEPNNKGNRNSLKWFVTIVASGLFIVSTLYRLIHSLEADRTLSFIFAFIAGLPWGANIIDYIKNK